MTDPVLYSFRRCPYAMRARMALYSSGIRCELREVVLKDKPSSMLEISPKGTVPVLLTPDNTAIDESLDIMVWALVQNDPESWLEADKNLVQGLIEHNDDIFKKNLDRYKYPNRYPDEDCMDSKEHGVKTLHSLEKRLTQNTYLLGNKPCLADIAIFPFIRQFAHVDKDWFYNQSLPKLQNWLINFLESPLFLSAMKKHIKWTPDSQNTYIN